MSEIKLPSVTSPTGCEGCGLSGGSRREFLAEGMRLAAGALLALGAAPGALRALEMVPGSGRRVATGTVAYPVPAGDGATVDHQNEVILVRFGGTLYAFALSCPHQNTALRWLAKEGRFQCPKHGSRYQPDDTFTSGRATRSMDRFPVQMVAGEIVVDTSRVLREDQDRAGWTAAAAHL